MYLENIQYNNAECYNANNFKHNNVPFVTYLRKKLL